MVYDEGLLLLKAKKFFFRLASEVLLLILLGVPHLLYIATKMLPTEFPFIWTEDIAKPPDDALIEVQSTDLSLIGDDMVWVIGRDNLT